MGMALVPWSDRGQSDPGDESDGGRHPEDRYGAPEGGQADGHRDGHRDGYYSRLEIPEPSMRELIDRTRALQRKNADTLKHMQKVRDEITADYAAEQRRQAQYDNDGKRRDGQ
jgi:hypothetical protein